MGEDRQILIGKVVILENVPMALCYVTDLSSLQHFRSSTQFFGFSSGVILGLICRFPLGLTWQKGKEIRVYISIHMSITSRYTS